MSQKPRYNPHRLTRMTKEEYEAFMRASDPPPPRVREVFWTGVFLAFLFGFMFGLIVGGL